MRWQENIEIIKIYPDQVDLENKEFYIPSFESLGQLIVSIRAVGFLNLPLVKQTEGGMFVPILGRRRIQASLQIDRSRLIEARLACPALNYEQAFLLAFWDNLDRIRSDVGSKAHVIARLMEISTVETLAQAILPSLNIPPRGPVLDRLRKIGGLEDDILKALSCGRINEKSASILSEMAAEQRHVLYALISQLALNCNKAFEVISNLFDISVYRNESIADLLEMPEAVSVIKDPDIKPTEKSEMFREIVRQWKFPEISRDQKNFNEWVRGLKLPDYVSVRPAQSFEDDSVCVEFRLQSRSDVCRLVNLERTREGRVCGLE